MKKNCWQVKKCGREPGGCMVDELGVCPSPVAAEYDGKNCGKNAGRYCWRVAGTFCGGKIQGTFSAKMLNCAKCPFFKQVREEEGDDFEA
ncbi:two-CW domain-containing protein [Candidatus Riflebacteria bacterium]